MLFTGSIHLHLYPQDGHYRGQHVKGYIAVSALYVADGLLGDSCFVCKLLLREFELNPFQLNRLSDLAAVPLTENIGKLMVVADNKLTLLRQCQTFRKRIV